MQMSQGGLCDWQRMALDGMMESTLLRPTKNLCMAAGTCKAVLSERSQLEHPLDRSTFPGQQLLPAG